MEMLDTPGVKNIMRPYLDQGWSVMIAGDRAI